MVTCPRCSSDDLDLVGREGDARTLRCQACGHEWIRGEQKEPAVDRPAAARRPEPPATFIDDDEGYIRWTERFPHGYVINTTRTPTPDYLILHEASCTHITVPFQAGNRWTVDYIKVCALQKRDILSWAEEQFGVKPQRCGTCQP